MTITLHTAAEVKLRDAAPDLAAALRKLVNLTAHPLLNWSDMPDGAKAVATEARAALAKAGL